MYVPINFASTTRWGAGGFCTRRGGCRRVNPEVSLRVLNGKQIFISSSKLWNYDVIYFLDSDQVSARDKQFIQ